MATIAPPLICPQGHGPGVAGSRFCTFCGATLIVPASPGQAPLAPGQPVPANPIATAPPAANGWQPVSTGTAQATAAPQWQSAPATAIQPPSGLQWQPSPVTPVPPPPSGPIPAPSATQAAPISSNQALPCKVCRNTGAGLSEDVLVCPECNWLRPLLPGYKVDRSVFLWAQDGQAMTKLQSISALHSAVKAVSDKVGRPWIESTFNGIRLGPRQFPDVWVRAVLAARILGLPKMPDVYISGDSQWNTYTYGTDTSAFIVLGTAILNNFQNDDLLFVLAREMGHCQAGHALWKTVSRFLVGDTSTHGILSNGVLNAISLSPTKWLQDAVDLPLMAWARQADITADRAGLFAIGDEALARRVILAWSIRSARLLKQVNIEEWMKQEDASDDQMTRFSEMTTTASMYTTRRLRLLGQSAREPELMRWSQTIQPVRKRLEPPAQTAVLPGMGPSTPGIRRPPATQGPAPAHAPAPPPTDSVRVLCNKCQTAMRIPLAALRGKPSLNVRCPKCQNIFTLRPKSDSQGPASQASAPAAAGTHPSTSSVSPSASTKPVAPPPSASQQQKPAAAASAASKPKPAAAPAASSAKAKLPSKPQAGAAHKQAR